MNKINLVIAALLSFISKPGCSQIKEYVMDGTVKINSAEMNDTQFDDLLPLQKAIGDRRIVMLGELYHGDGETFKLKARIVRFLHERMGFDVLVFESDFFSLTDGYELVNTGRITYDSLIRLSVAPIWTLCAQTRELFRYASQSMNGKHGAPLIISGLDNRGGSPYEFIFFKTRLDAFLKQTGIPFVQTPSYPLFMDGIGRAWTGRNKAVLDSLTASLPIIIDELVAKRSKSSSDPIDFYILVLRGLLDNYKMALHYWHSDEYKVHKKDYPMHDLGMAENLKWLVTRKYPNKKIIVWAHNAHVERREGTSSYAKYTSMGHFFTKDPLMADKTYIIGTTCYEGKGKIVGRDVVEKAAKPGNNSIESWMHSKNYEYAFVDLSKIPGKATIPPFHMKSYLTTSYRQNWTTVYDGVLYVKKADPCIWEKFNKN